MLLKMCGNVPLSAHWLGATLWMPSVVSAAAPPRPCRLLPRAASGVSPCHAWSSSSCCLLFFPPLLSFLKNPAFSWCARRKTASVLSLLSLVMFQVYLALGPTCSFFWWFRVHVELFCNTVFQRNPFLPPLSLLCCPTFASVHSNWE